MGLVHFENTLMLLLKVNVRILYEPAVALLGEDQQKCKHMLTKLHIQECLSQHSL